MHDLLETLGIKTVSVSETKVIISLNVTDSVKQPYGLLHGGVNTVMAETAASIGANQNVEANSYAVGVNVTTQHLRPVKSGTIVATAEPLHIGHQLQTWQVTITHSHHLTSTSTVTLTTHHRKSENS